MGQPELIALLTFGTIAFVGILGMFYEMVTLRDAEWSGYALVIGVAGLLTVLVIMAWVYVLRGVPQ